MNIRKLRYISAVLALILLLCTFSVPSFADFSPSSVTTPHIVLMDSASGCVMYEKTAHEKAYPASTTKIMTCILALESGKDLNETVTIGDSVEHSGSLMGFVRREEIKFIDLIYGMMLVSGNDAAQAIAEHISGSESEFANLMNQKAAELGMTGTHFVKSNGLHDENHYTTAYDMAILTRYAMQNETFREIVSTDTHQVPATNRDSDGYFLENTNKLIYTSPEAQKSYRYRDATGVKTGSTPYAKRCLVASAKKDGTELIVVLFGDEADDYRFESAANLFEWGFNDTASLSASELGLETSFNKQVTNASFSDINGGELTVNIDLSNAVIKTDASIVSAIKADPSLIESSIELTNDPLTAPIYEGQQLGTVRYTYDGTTLFTAPLTASRTVLDVTGSSTSGPNGQGSILLEPLTQGSSNNSWIFWVLVILLIMLVIMFIRSSANNKTRRKRKHQTAYRYKR